MRICHMLHCGNRTTQPGMKKMKTKKCAVHLTVILSVGFPVCAAASSLCSTPACKDSTAVSSLLLAAGMYGGVDAPSGEFSLSRSASTFKSLANVQGPLEGQDITLSYEGSSGGRLGFSAGYLYADPEEKRGSGSLLSDMDSYVASQQNAWGNDNAAPWYLAFNVAKEFQISDSIAFSLDSKATLLSPSALANGQDETDRRAVCMSFNLPVSYGSFLTVTPEVQWSRQLESSQATAGSNLSAASATDESADAFYGGMSITFSY